MKVQLPNRAIGDGEPCFIIAEAGINFNGSIDAAKQLINIAVTAGCDAIKFQAFTADNLYPKTAGQLDWQDAGKKYSYSIHENVKKFELPYSWIPELMSYAKQKNIMFFSSICDEQAGDIMDQYSVPLFKTTSYAITHLPLIEHLARKGKPLIMSTGGSTLEEIKEAYTAAKKYNSQLIILHCVIKYPTPLKLVNMNVLDTLKKEFPDAIIGYSDHTAEATEAPIAAIVKGAKVIEKHITLDKKMPGPDHFFALEPSELRQMVSAVRNTERLMRDGNPILVHPLVMGVMGSAEKNVQKEEEYLRNFAYQTIITCKAIRASEVISSENCKVLRPGKLEHGIEPKHYPLLTSGRYVAKADLAEGVPLRWENVIGPNSKSEKEILLDTSRAEKAGTVSMNSLNLAERKSAYIIAEIASAHCGSIEKFKSIIASSAEAGVDAVKFQIFDVDHFVSTFHPNYPNNKKNQLHAEQWREIFTYTQQFPVHIWADVFDEGSADLAEPYVWGFKLHSTDITNPFMLEHVAKKNKPVILAAGGATLEELKRAVQVLQHAENQQIILSHGFQAYPTDIMKVNLQRLKLLKKEFPQCIIGYHDHTDAELPLAVSIPLAAVAYGAMVLEKHVTDDRSLKGFDYESSLNPSELKAMVQQIRSWEHSLGDDSFTMSKDEQKYRDYTKRYLVAKGNIPAGKIITLNDLAFKRSSPKGLGASEYSKIVGRKTLRDILPDQTLSPKDVENKVAICLAVRLKSTRLPRKAVLDIQGQTAIEHQIDRLKRCKRGELILCTSTLPEDAPLLEIARKKGIRSFAGDPDDVMDRFYQASKLIDANIIVRTTGDCPLIDPEVVDRLIDHHLVTSADYTGLEDVPIGFEAEVIHSSTLLEARARIKDPKDTEFMTWFIKDPKHFRVEILPIDDEVRRNYRMTLDTPKDLDAIRLVFQELYPQNPHFGLRDVVALLDSRLDIASINMNYQQIKRPPKLEVLKQQTVRWEDAR